MWQGALSQLLQIPTCYLPPSQTASEKNRWHLSLVSRLVWLAAPLGDVWDRAGGRTAAAEVTLVP